MASWRPGRHGSPIDQRIVGGSPLDVEVKRSFSSQDAKLLDGRIERLEGLVHALLDTLLLNKEQGDPKGVIAGSTPRPSVITRTTARKKSIAVAAVQPTTPRRSRLSKPSSMDETPFIGECVVQSDESGQQVYDVTKLDGAWMIDTAYSEVKIINDNGAWMIDVSSTKKACDSPTVG